MAGIFAAAVAWGHPEDGPACPPPDAEAGGSAVTRARRAFAERMLAFDDRRPRIGGGFQLQLVGLSGHVRIRGLGGAVSHVDVRLGSLVGAVFEEPHGWIASLRLATFVGGEVALVPESVVQPILGVSVGATTYGLRFPMPRAVVLGTVGMLVDPPGPFEMRIGVQAGLLGERRSIEDGTTGVPAFGLIPDIGLGATW